MAEHVISLAEPAGAGLLEQQWLRGVPEERQNASASKAARAMDEPISWALEVLETKSLHGTGQNFNDTHPGTLAPWSEKSTCRRLGGFIWVQGCVCSLGITLNVHHKLFGTL